LIPLKTQNPFAIPSITVLIYQPDAYTPKALKTSRLNPRISSQDYVGTVAEKGEQVFNDFDCLVVVYLSHGTNLLNKDAIIGIDENSVDIDKLIKPFKSCQPLAGKPKVFIFQVWTEELLRQSNFSEKSKVSLLTIKSE
jgi:Caspase domain